MISFLQNILLMIPLTWSAGPVGFVPGAGRGGPGFPAGASLSAEGPLVVRNGAGLSEFYLVYAQRRHESLIRLCQVQAVCAQGLESSLADLLRVGSSPDLRLEFLTSVEMGDRLMALQTGAVLQINKDKLFKSTDLGLQPWGYADAVRFFVGLRAKALGWGETMTAAVSSRLADLADVVQERAMNPDYHNLSLVLFTAPVSALIIEDKAAGREGAAVEIPLSGIHCGDSNQRDVPVDGLKVLNAKWMASDARETQTSLLSATGAIEYSCVSAAGTKQAFRSRYRVTLRAENHAGVWNLKLDRIAITQEDIRELFPAPR